MRPRPVFGPRGRGWDEDLISLSLTQLIGCPATEAKICTSEEIHGPEAIFNAIALLEG